MSVLGTFYINKLKLLKNKITKLRTGSRVFLYLWLIVIFVGSQVLFLEPVGAAVSVRNAQSGSTTGGTSFAVTKPTGTIAGDILIATVGVTGNPTFGFSSGSWTSIDRTLNGATMVLETFWLRAGSSEPASYTISWTGTQRGAGGIIGVKGAESSGSPIDNSGNAHSANSGVAAGNYVASQVTTSTNNTLLIASYAKADNAAIANPGSMAEQYDLTGNGTGTDIRTSGNTESFGTAGATGTRTATGSSVVWAAQMVALTPESSLPTLDQSSYRFLSNLDVSNSEFIQSNPTVGADDSIRGVAVDTANGFMYIGGSTSTSWLVQKRSLADGSLDASFTYPSPLSGTLGGLAIFPTDNSIFVVGLSGGQQRIEKRRMSDGALCTAANCGTLFGTGGVVSPGFSGSANDVDIDTVNGHIYVGGFETSGDDLWRIGKYLTSTGAAVAAFTQGSCSAPTNGSVCSDPAAGNDRIRTMAVDPAGGYVYAGGWDTVGTDNQWRMEKRRMSDGALCTAPNCGTAFDGDGIYQIDPNATTDDQLLTFQVDTAGNAIFLGGYDANGSPANTNEWRLQKLNAATGALCTAPNCGTAFDGDGILTYDSPTSSSNDQLLDLDLDDAGGFLYTTGQDAGTSAADLEWRIEKRNRSDGALVTSFGTGGVVSVNPSSSNPDSPARIAVDLPRNFLYTSGGDRTISGTDQQWRVQKFDLDTGGIWLGAEDTAAVASTNISFRLRLLLHVNSQQMLSGAETFKLQFAPKIGTCDTAFVDEIYTDVTTSSNEVKYHDNPALSDAAAAVSITGEPTHGGDPTVLESMEESNSFSPIADIPAASDGEWDFVLQDNNAFGAYCFRVTYNDGTPTLLSSYTVVPELSFCRNEPTTDKLLRGGTYFCSGTKRAFFWAQ